MKTLKVQFLPNKQSGWSLPMIHVKEDPTKAKLRRRVDLDKDHLRGRGGRLVKRIECVFENDCCFPLAPQKWCV